MDIVVPAVFAAIFFYILYGVIRAATRDGIIAARRHAEKNDAAHDGASLDRPLSQPDAIPRGSIREDT